MPRLNERKGPKVATMMNLSTECRANLEAAIGFGNIKTLTDAVEEASKLLAEHVKQQSPHPLFPE